MNNYSDEEEVYKSLAPTDKTVESDYYDPIISEVLTKRYNNGKLKNKNIAITGIYGSGKSSLIMSYFNDHVDDYKCIKVSLGKYYNDNKIKNNKKEYEENIENSLLQQIIYNARPNSLPFSSIRRSDIDVKSNNRIAFLLSVLISFVIYFFNYESLTKIFNNFLNNSYLRRIIKNYLGFYPQIMDCFENIFITIFFILSFVVVSMLLFFIVRKIKLFSYIRRISFKGNELEIDEHTTSRLSVALDELIHFFMMTEFNIVIFEDIDRLDNSIEVFTKIKEINEIINNSINCDSMIKEIQFIYEINDSIFDTSEHRTKFFDAIIPVVSRTVTSTSYFDLQNLFDPFNIDSLKEKDYIFVGAYVSNLRIAYDIYNEFKIYYETNKDLIRYEDIRVLFYLVSYKALFPRRFNNLLNNIGPLAYVLSEDYKKDYLNEYNGMINYKANIEIKNLQKVIDNKRLDIKKELINRIDSAIGSDNNIVFCDSSNTPIFNYDNLKEEWDKYIDIVFNENLIIRQKNDASNNNLSIIIFPGDTKNSYYEKYKCESLFQQQERIKVDIIKNQKPSFYEIDDDSFDKDFNSNLSKKKSYGKYRCDNNIMQDDEDYNALNDYEKYIYKNKLIDNSYGIYFTDQKGDIGFIKDIIIFNNLVKDVDYDIKTYIDNPSYFVTLIDDELIKKDSFCLEMIYNEMSIKEDYHHYFEIIAKNLSINKMSNMMRMNNDKVFKQFANYYDNIWNYIKEKQDIIELNIVKYYIIKTIKFANYNTFKNDFFINTIETIEDIDYLFEMNYDQIKNNLKNYSLDFKQNIFNSNNKNILEYLYNNDMFGENIELLSTILISKGFTIKKNKLVESFLDTDELKVLDLLVNNYKAIIDFITINQSDDNKSMKKFITYFDSDVEYVHKFLEKEKTLFTSIINLDKIYPIIDNLNKYVVNINNLNYLYNYYVINKNENHISENMLNNIENNYQTIFNDKYYDKYHDIINELLYKYNISINSFKHIAKFYYSKSNKVFKGLLSDIDKNIYLIENHWLLFDDIEKIIEFYNNDDYLSNIHMLLLSNSFEKIIDSYSENIKKEMLLDILDLNISNNQSKLNYVLKYVDKDVFDSDVSNKVTSIIVNNNYNITKEIMMKILNKSNNISNISKCCNVYYELIGFETINELLSNKDNEYKDLIALDGNKTRYLTFYNYELDFILKIIKELPQLKYKKIIGNKNRKKYSFIVKF